MDQHEIHIEEDDSFANNPDRFQLRAKQIVIEYYNALALYTRPISKDEVYVVWFAKSLQNWKALVSTIYDDKMYFEVTYNGDRREAYLDAYLKTNNVVISDIPAH